MVRALLATLFLIFAIGAANSEAASANKTDIAKLKERIMHSRAFETVIWSVPLMNYTAMRNGYKKGAGVDYNDVVYHSKVQTWELEMERRRLEEERLKLEQERIRLQKQRQ